LLMVTKVLFTIIILIWNLDLLNGQPVEEKNSPLKHSTLTNKTFVDKINGHPITFYLNHKDILPAAKQFYKGEYALYDDGETFGFLDGILTDNNETRPFYIYIYEQAMKVTDGALAEYMAGVCRRYFVKYPCEFLSNKNDEALKLDIEKWTELIGFDIYDLESFKNVTLNIDKEIKKTCTTYSKDWDKVKMLIEKNLEKK
jgi:hypothetical protein